jgi:hypothetical protein
MENVLLTPGFVIGHDYDREATDGCGNANWNGVSLMKCRQELLGARWFDKDRKRSPTPIRTTKDYGRLPRKKNRALLPKPAVPFLKPVRSLWEVAGAF